MAQVTIQHQEPLQLTGKKTYASEDLQAVSDSVNCERKCLGYKEEKPKHGEHNLCGECVLYACHLALECLLSLPHAVF